MSAATRYPSSGNSRVRYPLGGVLVFLSLALVPGVPSAADPSASVKPDLVPPAAAGTETREQHVTKRVASGDTLPRLLMDLGVSSATRNRWLQAVAKQLGVANVLREGDAIGFYFTAAWDTSGPGQLTALQIERAGSRPLTWQLRDDQIVYHRQTGRRPTTSVAKHTETSAEAVPPVATQGQTGAKAPTEVASAVEQVTHVLRKGENLGRVLRAKGVTWKAAQPWIRVVEKRYSLKRLYPGRKIVLYFVATPSNGGSRRTLRALQIESWGRDLLTWQWTDGQIKYRGRNHQVVLGKAVPAPAPVKTPIAKGAPAAAAPESLPPTRSFEPLEKVIRTVSRGQTLGGILKPLGVTGKEAEAWFDAIDKQYPVTNLRPGQRLHLYFDRTPARHRRDNLKAVELEVKKNRRLSWERVGKKIRFGKGLILDRGRTIRDAISFPSNGLSSASQKRAFLSEYALARIKQRKRVAGIHPAAK